MNSATRTYFPKAGDAKQNWRVFDATNRPLGRLASEVAQVLRGKDKPTYTPNADTGDYVIVVNASKVVVTGAKTREKMYYTHSNYPGGFRQTAFDKMLSQHPRRIVEWAVWGMLPKGPLGRDLFRKLKVYAEETHPHGAQVSESAAPMKMGKPGKPRPMSKKAAAAVAANAPAPAAATATATAKAPATPRRRAAAPRAAAGRTAAAAPAAKAPAAKAPAGKAPAARAKPAAKTPAAKAPAAKAPARAPRAPKKTDKTEGTGA